jgi:hypothetical protein
MPHLERRARFRELRKKSASFRAFYWRLEGVRILVTALLAGLIFFTFRGSLGAFSLLASVILVSALVEVILCVVYITPRAEIEHATLAERAAPRDH